jgi:pimeloyl-ACP methyl ester carboxylesterase
MKKLRLLFVGISMLLLSGCKDALIRHFAFFPEKVATDMRIELPGVSEVFLTTSDDVRIHSLYVEQKGAKQVVLFFHGNAGNAYHRIPDAVALSRTGVNVMLVSYRGYGKSEGIPNEVGLYRDADAAYEYLVNQRHYALKDIYLLGRSLGSATAIHLAQDRKLGGIILITPITTGKEISSKIGLGWMTWMMSPFFDNMEKIKRIKSPALVIHGDADSIIPFSIGEKVYQAVPVEDKRFIRIKGAGHNDLTLVAGPVFWRLVGEFIQRTSQPLPKNNP